MPRRLRVEFEGAIDHIMARGNGRQQIVHDDRDRERLVDDLHRTVANRGWVLLAVVQDSWLRCGWLVRMESV
jgi:hypothetical protein